MKKRFEKLKGEGFQRIETKFCKETAVEKTDEIEETNNSKFPVILIDEGETIFIEVESN